MIVEETDLAGVKIILFGKKKDARGLTDTTLDYEGLNEKGICFPCVQQRIYQAPKQGTFYGIHFQDQSHPQAKLIDCLRVTDR